MALRAKGSGEAPKVTPPPEELELVLVNNTLRLRKADGTEKVILLVNRNGIHVLAGVSPDWTGNVIAASSENVTRLKVMDVEGNELKRGV